jgi:hypothetical protein
VIREQPGLPGVTQLGLREHRGQQADVGDAGDLGARSSAAASSTSALRRMSACAAMLAASTRTLAISLLQAIVTIRIATSEALARTPKRPRSGRRVIGAWRAATVVGMM